MGVGQSNRKTTARSLKELFQQLEKVATFTKQSMFLCQQSHLAANGELICLSNSSWLNEGNTALISW